MLLADTPFQYFEITAHATLSDRFLRSFSYFTPEHTVTVLCDPYKVILNVVKTMGPCSVLCHQSASLAKDAKALRL